MMKLVTTFFFLVSVFSLYSQNEWWKKNTTVKEDTGVVQNEVPSPQFEEYSEVNSLDSVVDYKVIQGSVTVNKNPLVDKIIRFKSTTIPPYTGPIMSGYRVQLFFDQDRSAVDKARSKAMMKDNETPTYIEYNTPNYLLLQGDFRTKLEAEKKRAEMLDDFPSALVKEDKIYLPKIQTEE